MELQDDWRDLLRYELQQQWWKQLNDAVEAERRSCEVFPPSSSVFAAFRSTRVADVKVVIVGQDPYHGAGQANGLAFSVARGTRVPPSLRNIFRELHDDIGVDAPADGDLTPWARQGVLLLNTVLTVRSGQAASHRGLGWERFTDAVLAALDTREERIVFVLWGNDARNRKSLITNGMHSIIESAHPSPLSARNGFFGSRPFSRANAELVTAGRTPVDWSLPAHDSH